jgi:hypothetical protein
MEYDDGLIACSDDGLVIRRYGALRALVAALQELGPDAGALSEPS